MQATTSRWAVPQHALVLLAGALAAASAVSGHGPLWMLPVWALALGLWSLSERRRSILPALALLLALLPAWTVHQDLLAFTALYLRYALSGLAAALFVQHLDEQGHWGWLALLALAWALAPTPIGLFGLLASALLRAGAVQRGARRVPAARAAGWLLGLAALLALGAALLPRPALPLAAHPSGQVSAQPPAKAAQAPPAAPTAQRSAPRLRPIFGLPGVPPASFLVLERLTPYLLLALALLSSTLLLLALRERGRREGRLRPEDLLMVAGLLAGFGMTLLYFLLRQRGISGGVTPGQEAPGSGPGSALGNGPPVSHLDLSGALNAAGWLAVGSSLLFLALSAVGLWFLLRSQLARGRVERASAPHPAAPAPPLPPEHRIRRAYRLLLALLEGHALGRQGSETPQEYLGRLRDLHPELADPAQTITRLYEPVRYGGQSDEAGALAAEDALDRIRRRLETA